MTPHPLRWFVTGILAGFSVAVTALCAYEQWAWAEVKGGLQWAGS